MLTSTTTSIPIHERKLLKFTRLQEFGLVIVILLLGAFLTRVAPTIRGENGFLRTENLLASVLTPMSWYAIMAVGVTIVIISGGIDISVGSIMGLASLGTAAVLQKLDPDTSKWIAIPVGILVPLAIGILCGFVNGALIVSLDLHPFIVTLGTLSIFRGIAINAIRQGSLPFGDQILPTAFTDNFIALTINWRSLEPVPSIIMLGVMLVGWFYLTRTIWGRETYAIGGNEEAARFAGIPVKRAKLRTYVISGMCAGIAGMVNCGFYKSAATSTGSGYELDVIAAAVVGGASLSGGRGTALGAILGTLIMQMIINGIAVLSNHDMHLGPIVLTVQQTWKMIIVGASIIIAAAIDRVTEKIRIRRRARHVASA